MKLILKFCLGVLMLSLTLVMAEAKTTDKSKSGKASIVTVKKKAVKKKVRKTKSATTAKKKKKKKSAKKSKKSKKAKKSRKSKKSRKPRAIAAKKLFGKIKKAANVKPHAYGSYTRGCFAGGQQLAETGPAWQAMRLSRNRNWGHPETVAYVEQLAKDAKAKDGWNGLLVGDISQPRGGPMITGHASHQMGMDADIWLLEAPKKRLSEKLRENITAISVLTKNKKRINRKIWTKGHFKLLRRAASYKNVARIFINPVIKRQLCKEAGKDRNWLRKFRPWRGHHYHFHVRLRCPKGDKGCKNQAIQAAGDGCGGDLARWFKPPKKIKRPKGYKFKFIPKPELTMANLPRACGRVLKQ